MVKHDFALCLGAVAFRSGSASHVLALDHFLQLPQPLNHLQGAVAAITAAVCVTSY